MDNYVCGSKLPKIPNFVLPARQLAKFSKYEICNIFDRLKILHGTSFHMGHFMGGLVC